MISEVLHLRENSKIKCIVEIKVYEYKYYKLNICKTQKIIIAKLIIFLRDLKNQQLYKKDL